MSNDGTRDHSIFMFAAGAMIASAVVILGEQLSRQAANHEWVESPVMGYLVVAGGALLLSGGALFLIGAASVAVSLLKSAAEIRAEKQVMQLQDYRYWTEEPNEEGKPELLRCDGSRLVIKDDAGPGYTQKIETAFVSPEAEARRSAS